LRVSLSVIAHLATPGGDSNEADPLNTPSSSLADLRRGKEPIAKDFTYTIPRPHTSLQTREAAIDNPVHYLAYDLARCRSPSRQSQPDLALRQPVINESLPVLTNRFMAYKGGGDHAVSVANVVGWFVQAGDLAQVVCVA